MRSFCGICILSSVLAFGFVAAQDKKPADPKTIDADQLAKLLEKPENIYFLDVREPSEIAQLGSIKGYVNIPLSQLEKRITEVPKDKLVVTL